MCNLFGGGNDAVDEARQARIETRRRETERQRAIARGEAHIDRIFSQAFGLPFTPRTPAAPSTPSAPTTQPGLPAGSENWTAAQLRRFRELSGGQPVGEGPEVPSTPVAAPASPAVTPNTSFFDNFARAYRDAYFPQLDLQYDQAQDRMAATLADRGVLESTPGAAQMADLLGRYNQTRSQVESDAQGAVNDMRSRVQSARTNLYGMNAVAANPAAALAQAQGQATALAAPQSFSPLGQVFESFLHNAGAFNQANRNSANPMSFNSGPQLYSPSGSGSSRVVS